jgi:hypothetical protein
MLGYWSARHTLGFDRFPETRGSGTIPSEEAQHDGLNDLIGARLRRLWSAQQRARGWTAELEHQCCDLERICALHGYVALWVDPRDYLVHRVGQSILYDVPIDKRGHLAPFAGKRVRVACLHNGRFRLHVWIGVVGEAHIKRIQRKRKAEKPQSVRPPLPRLLREDELASTPHLLARFAGTWISAGGMARAYNRGLRYQAAVWYSRRFKKLTGSWPQGTHEFIIKYGPTDDFEIRTPIGNHKGYCELRLHFEVHPEGAAFVRGNAEVGFNWCGFSLGELEACATLLDQSGDQPEARDTQSPRTRFEA